MKDGKIKGKWNVLIPCVNQDTGKSLRKGDIITELSVFEFGRLNAFNYIEMIRKKRREKIIKTEKREGKK